MTLAIGTRVRLIHDVDRYPHFIAPKDSLGTVTYNDPNETFCVRLDDHLPGSEEWGNEVVWSVRDGDDPSQDVTPA